MSGRDGGLAAAVVRMASAAVATDDGHLWLTDGGVEGAGYCRAMLMIPVVAAVLRESELGLILSAGVRVLAADRPQLCVRYVATVYALDYL